MNDTHQTDTIFTCISEGDYVTPNVCPQCLPGTKFKADTWHPGSP